MNRNLTAEGGGAQRMPRSMENHASLPESSCGEIFVMVTCRASAPVIPFIFQNEKILRPGRVESKVGDGIADGSENRIVEFALKILGIFSKHYFVARTCWSRRRWCHSG